MKKTIICIGREYGRGGHAIGKILAKRTGYESVSYTHLDVYKRQSIYCPKDNTHYFY